MEFFNNEISFYEIDFDYVKQLHDIDSVVYYHSSYKTDIKPYVGIMLSISGIKYFVPLTSAKQRHGNSNWKLSTRDYLTIYEKVPINTLETNAIYRNIQGDKEYKHHILGVLDIRKMIPVPDGKFSKIDFGSLNLNYQFLFYKEHEFCKSNQDKIMENAKRLYELTESKGHKISKFHCDYKLLEQQMSLV